MACGTIIQCGTCAGTGILSGERQVRRCGICSGSGGLWIPTRTCSNCGKTAHAARFEQWGQIVPVWLCRFGCKQQEG